MDTNAMRLAISQCYPSKKWRDKCQNMSTEQVVAIYKSF